MNKSKLLILGVIILMLSAWVYYFNFISKNDFVEVKRGNLIEKFNVVGKIVASNNIEIGFEEKGKVEKVHVALGDEVKQGDLLAILETKKLDAEIKKAQAQVGLAKAKLSQLLAGTRDEELNFFETQVNSTRINLENALRNFENVKIKADSDIDGVYQVARDLADPILLSTEKAMQVLNSIYQPSNQFQPFFFVADFKKKSDAKWQIIFTRDAFLKVKEDYQSLKDNPSNENTDKILSNFKVNLELIRVALNKTSEALESATVVSGNTSLEEFKKQIIKTREDVNLIQTEILNKEQSIKEQKVINQTNITAVDNIVNSKRAILSEKENQLALKKAKPRDVEIGVYEAQIKEAEALKYLLLQRKNNTKIFAPISGIVKSINIKKGQFVKAQSPAISINGLSDFQIEAEILRKDIKKLSISDEVDILINAGNKTIKKIKGNIIEIDTNREILKNNKSFFRVLIATPENTLFKLNPNMTVDLIVNAVLKRNVLIIPENAIIEKNKISKVTLLEGNSTREVEIETGARSYKMVEVLSGLYEGDRVVVQ
jgi:HlyD family secretion protein